MCAQALDADWFDEMALASHAKQVRKKALPPHHIMCLKNLLSSCCGSSQRIGFKDFACKVWMSHHQQQLTLFVYKFATHVNFSLPVILL